MKILLIEDDPTTRSFLELTLQAENFDYISCDRGSLAIEVARDFCPDVVISDLLLKEEQDGVMVCNQILDLCQQTDVILVTGVPLDELRRRAAETSRFTVMQKPYDLDQLVRKVRALAEVKASSGQTF